MLIVVVWSTTKTTKLILITKHILRPAGGQYINKYLLFNLSSQSRPGYTRKGIETGGFLVGDKRGCRWGHTRPSLGTHEVVVGDRQFLPLSRTGNG